MNQQIAVVGAGIAGLCSALALSRRGFQVTLFERDQAPPPGTPDQAFFEWERRGAAQFRHPHAFLGLMCSLLEEHYPDLLDAFFAAGARRVGFKDMVPPHLLDEYVPQEEDKKLWVLMSRRATMETVLRDYVSAESNITIMNRTYVTNVIGEMEHGKLRLSGLEITHRSEDNQTEHWPCDAVVDATGRTSKFPNWLTTAHPDLVVDEQVDDAQIVYYTRHYKLKPGVEEPPRHSKDPSAGDLGYMKYGVFPGDGGHFALIICLPNAETALREAVKDGDKFDEICRTIPGLVPWIAEGRAEATTPSFGIGQIHAVWRNYLAEGQPQILNFFAVGDSSVRTNPLYGRGCSTGILHGHLLAEVLAENDSPEARAIEFQKQTDERLRPIFDASLQEDKNGIKRAEAVMNNQPRDQADSLKKWFGLAFGDALAAAVRDEMHVFRGMMRTVNLIEKPGEFLKDPKVRRTVFRYMLRGRKRNGTARVQRGLSRDDMMQRVTKLQEV
ncbi:MAG: FAD-dependent oxidoreductase [Pseudomonadota bacterium]